MVKKSVCLTDFFIEKKCTLISSAECNQIKQQQHQCKENNIQKKCALLQGKIDNFSRKNYLGRGEFAKAWLVDDLVIKENTDSSLFNQDTTYKDVSREKMLERSAKMMESEFNAYQQVLSSSIVPKFLCQYKYDKQKLFHIREAGDIPTIEKGALPKWKKGAVNQKDYDKFVHELYEIATTKGYFEDRLQPALRKDGSLFLVDLGFFVSHPKQITHDDLVSIYYNVDFRLKHLSEQLGLKYTIPRKIVDFHINYYQNEYQNAKTLGMKRFRRKELEEWQNK